MSLPIDSEAIAACDKTEHEYSERLMDLAAERASAAGHESVSADDVEWAVGTYVSSQVVKLNRGWGAWCTPNAEAMFLKSDKPVEIDAHQSAASDLQIRLGGWVDAAIQVYPAKLSTGEWLVVGLPRGVCPSKIPQEHNGYRVQVGRLPEKAEPKQLRCICAEKYGRAKE